MRAQGRPKRTPEPVPIEAAAWNFWGEDEQAALENAAAQRTFWVRLPKARKTGQRGESKHGRLVLLWSGDVTETLTVCAAVGVASHDCGAFALVIYRGHVVADYTPDVVPGRGWNWHKRRAIENAKAAVAGMREHLPTPTKPDDEAWLRRQLGALEPGGLTQ